MPVSRVEVSIVALELSSKSKDKLQNNYSLDISKEAKRALQGPTLVRKPGFRVVHQTICQSRSVPEMSAAHG